MNIRPIRPVRARDLGPLFQTNTLKMIGQDGAYSFPVDPRQALWVFGDTFVGSLDQTGRRVVDKLLNNSALICPRQDPAAGLQEYQYLTNHAGELRQLLFTRADEDAEIYRLWGMHGCCVQSRIYWFYVRVRILPQASWPFKFDVAGSGLAVADWPDCVFERIEYHGSTLIWAPSEPCFGVAVLPRPETGWIYIYGSVLRAQQHECMLARAPVDGIADPGRYEYLVTAQPKWSRNPGDAISILTGMPTEMSVSYNPYLGGYLAVYSWEISGRIIGRTAPQPWGPWSDPVVLWTPQVPLRNPLVYNGPLIYAGKEHPELAKMNGQIIYLTCVEFEEYFPRLIEVEL